MCYSQTLRGGCPFSLQTSPSSNRKSWQKPRSLFLKIQNILLYHQTTIKSTAFKTNPKQHILVSNGKPSSALEAISVLH